MHAPFVILSLLIPLVGCHVDTEAQGASDASPISHDASPHHPSYSYSGVITVSENLSVPEGGRLLALLETSVSSEELPDVASEQLGESLLGLPWGTLEATEFPADLDVARAVALGEGTVVTVLMDVDSSTTVSAGDLFGQLRLDVDEFEDVSLGLLQYEISDVELVIDSTIPFPPEAL